MAQLRNWILVCLIAATGTVHAQTLPNDTDYDLLYNTKNPPPNIAILLDDSISMAQPVWVTGGTNGFNTKKFYDSTVAVNGACGAGMGVTALAGSAGQCVNSGHANNECPDNDLDIVLALSTITCTKAFFSNTNPCALVAGTQMTCTWPASGSTMSFKPPDVSPGVLTRWSTNYLDWMILEMKAGRSPGLPASQKDRLETIKSVIEKAINDLITAPDPNHVKDPNNPALWNKAARFGLWGFDPAKNVTYDPNSNGGELTVLSGTDTNGSHGAHLYKAIGEGTHQDLFAAIDGMRAKSWTPLGESLLDIARAMSGNTAVGTSTDLKSVSATAGAPMADAPCAKNFVIILTDGEPTQDLFDHTPFGDASGSSTKFKVAIGDADGSGNDPGPPAGVAAYQFNGTDYLDDVAYYIFKNDLRPEGMLSSGALAGNQNISTYVVGFAVDHPLLKHTAQNGDGLYFPASNAQELDDSITNAVFDIVARSGAFSAASIPSTRTKVNDALFTAFFEPAKDVNFWTGHLQAYKVIDVVPTDPNAVNDPDFTIIGTDGKPATDKTTGEFLEPRNTFFWDAQKCLALTDPNCNVATRKLYYNKAAVRTDFTTANVTAAELGFTTDPNEYTPYPTDPAGGPVNAANNNWTQAEITTAVTNFVRGEDAFNGDKNSATPVTVRRAAVLGDIFHSNPLAVGGVPFFLSNEPGYGPINTSGTPPTVPSFYDKYYARNRVLYAGANDGMLHAFDAGTLNNPDLKPITGDESYSFGKGGELFGYVANNSLKTLKELVKTGIQKPFYMDGSPVAADAWLPLSGTDVTKDPNEWTTVLVEGMRNGGDAYLALDITDPNAASSATLHGAYPKLLWEFNDPNEFLGKTWGSAVITRVKLKGGFGGDFCGIADDDGKTATLPADCRETWVAIFSGGYLEQGDPMSTKFIADPNNASWTKDSRSIYIVRLQTGQVLARATRDPLDNQLKNMTYSFPSTPAVADLNADGFADVVYVGDTGGQMWKWDISAVATPDVTGKVDATQWPIGRFFTAPIASNLHVRSIYYPPSLSFVKGKLRVAFGTGERTKLDFPSLPGTDDNQFYVVQDSIPTGTGAIPTTPHLIGELSQLLSTQDVDPNPADLGFFFVPPKDEKFVTDSVTFEGFVVTLSYNPDLNLSPPPPACEQGGHSQLYIFSIADGHGFFTDKGTGEAARRLQIGRGLPTSPRISQLGKSSDVVVQTSTGQLIPTHGPKSSAGDIRTIFWRSF